MASRQVTRVFAVMFFFAAVCCFVAMRAQTLSRGKQAQKKDIFVTTVQFGDRVDKNEALAIAKEFLYYEGVADQYYLKRFGVGSGFLVKELNGVWHVVFLKRATDPEIGRARSMRVTIDPESAQVLSAQEQDGFYTERR